MCCLCSRSSSLDKLSPYSIKCVFVCTLILKKGISVTILLRDDTLSLLMLPFMNPNPFLSLVNPVLISCGTWDLVSCLARTNVVGYCWVYTIKYKPGCSVDRYKAHPIARGFTQTFGIDYTETFSPIAKLNSISVLLSISINQSWKLC